MGDEELIAERLARRLTSGAGLGAVDVSHRTWPRPPLARSYRWMVPTYTGTASSERGSTNTRGRTGMGDINKWCQMCGAAPGEPCTYISDNPPNEPEWQEPGRKAGAPRPDVHWARDADHKPAVLIPDEPPWSNAQR